MNREECKSCKMRENNSAVEDAVETGKCSMPYSAVKVCMSANKGSISLCRKEWDQFKICYEKSRK